MFWIAILLKFRAARRYGLKHCVLTYPQIFLHKKKKKRKVLSSKTMQSDFEHALMSEYICHALTLCHRIKCLVCFSHTVRWIKNEINVPKYYLMRAIHLTVSNLLLYLAVYSKHNKHTLIYLKYKILCYETAHKPWPISIYTQYSSHGIVLSLDSL